MIEWIMITIWLVGSLLSIYPLYQRILAHNITRYTNNITGPEAIGYAIGAMAGSIVWPFAIPFVASYFIHTLRKPSLEADVEHIRMQEQVKVRMAAARREIEAVSRKVEEELELSLGGYVPKPSKVSPDEIKMASHAYEAEKWTKHVENLREVKGW